MNKYCWVMVVGMLSLGFSAAMSQTLTYQGDLTNTDGDAVTASYSIVFSLYPDGSSMDAVWSETHPAVEIVDGFFSVELGNLTAISPIVAQESTLYLGVQIGEGDELQPRMQVGASLFSFRAQHAVDVSGEDIHPNSVRTNLIYIGDVPVIDQYGNWVGNTDGLRGEQGPKGDPVDLSQDTDGDEFEDWIETAFGTDPDDPFSTPIDLDDDKVPDGLLKGEKGDPGRGILDVLVEDDASGALHIYYDDDTSYLTGPLRGPKGEKGDPGTSIESVELVNSELLVRRTGESQPLNLGSVKGEVGASIQSASVDQETGRLSLFMTDERTVPVTGLVKGEKGEKGEKGDDGASIETVKLENGDLVVTFTGDPEVKNLGSIIGEKGEPGDPGVSIESATVDDQGQLKLEMTNDTFLEVGIVKGPKGDPGNDSAAEDVAEELSKHATFKSELAQVLVSGMRDRVRHWSSTFEFKLPAEGVSSPAKEYLHFFGETPHQITLYLYGEPNDSGLAPTQVRISINGVDVTTQFPENPNGWGTNVGEEAWSSGPIDLSQVTDWSASEHEVEFTENGETGGQLKAYIYAIQSSVWSDTCAAGNAGELGGDAGGPGSAGDAGDDGGLANEPGNDAGIAGNAGDDGGLGNEPGNDAGMVGSGGDDGGLANEPGGDAGIAGNAGDDGGLVNEPGGDAGIAGSAGDDGGLVNEPGGDAGIAGNASDDGGLANEPDGDAGVSGSADEDSGSAGEIGSLGGTVGLAGSEGFGGEIAGNEVEAQGGLSVPAELPGDKVGQSGSVGHSSSDTADKTPMP